MDIKNQWLHSLFMGRNTNDFLNLCDISHFKKIFIYSKNDRRQDQKLHPATFKKHDILDNISILGSTSYTRAEIFKNFGASDGWMLQQSYFLC